jgi:hypothetical protein
MQAVIDFRLASLEPHRHVFETCRVSANLGGAEHIGPEDTFDADYGRLLERAMANQVKGDTSPAGFEPAS